MSSPFLGEIRIFSFNFAPKGWAFCNGQLLPINQEQALFSLLGTTYGGNGTVNFALPNLQGNTPLHFGDGLVQGQVSGEQIHTLSLSEIPAHAHSWSATSSAANTPSPTGNLLGAAQAYERFGVESRDDVPSPVVERWRGPAASEYATLPYSKFLHNAFGDFPLSKLAFRRI